MNKIKHLFFSVLALAVMALPTFAQADAGAADNASTVAAYKAIGGGILFAIAVGLGALGQGKIGSSAVESAARNPSAAGQLQTMMILGLAFIESLVIFALVIMFVKF
jgi:F-type H+-transporting ATPase subunit c